MPVSSSPLKSRCLTLADLAIADELRSLAGWNQTLADWERLVAFSPEGCFLAEWDGAGVGTVTTTAYGAELAWIGMMLVHPEYRRRGIAKALMERAIQSLQGRGVKCIKLDATPAGEPVYRQLGFEPEWELQRWERETMATDREWAATETAPVAAEPFSVRYPATLDRTAFGADRGDWLRLLSMCGRSRSMSRGFGLLRPGMLADYIGPVVAEDESQAEVILRELLAGTSRRVFWDIPRPNVSAEAFAKQFGFRPVRSLRRMSMGPTRGASNPRLQYAIGDPATG